MYFLFKENSKTAKSSFTKWSKEVCGDISQQLLLREDIVKIKEKILEEAHNAENKKVSNIVQEKYKKCT